LEYLNQIRKKALHAHQSARDAMMKRTRHLRLPTYQIGDTIWLNNKHLKLNVPNRKLYQKRDGPFEITHKISPVNYRLKLPPQWKIHNTYEVEAILNHKERRRKTHYLIKWKGYPHSENTWEPEENLEMAKRILKRYKKSKTLD
ncbi:Histone-lysine N-methyltransferase SUV39H1, partial [Leucoagaricus sp. SymC.cos]